GVRTLDDLSLLTAFFEARRGRLHGFRFKDFADCKSCAPGATPAATDQVIGMGDGAAVTFALRKTYSDLGGAYVRAIVKPVAGSVTVALDGVGAGEGWSVDSATGLVTFDVAPGAGVAVTAGFQFDTPVRFDTDQLSI